MTNVRAAFYTTFLDLLKRSGKDAEFLAMRTGARISDIRDLLESPENWTVEVVSNLFLALGYEPILAIKDLPNQRRPDRRHHQQENEMASKKAKKRKPTFKHREVVGGRVSVASKPVGQSIASALSQPVNQSGAARPVGQLEGELLQNASLLGDLIDAVAAQRQRIEVALRPAIEVGEAGVGGPTGDRPAGSPLTMQARDLNTRLAVAIQQIRDITDRVDV